MARVSTANAPYTIWWVIFNNPEKCATSPCDAPDLFDEAVDAAVFNAGGSISAASGDDETGVINLDISVLAGERLMMRSGTAPMRRASRPP